MGSSVRRQQPKVIWSRIILSNSHNVAPNTLTRRIVSDLDTLTENLKIALSFLHSSQFAFYAIQTLAQSLLLLPTTLAGDVTQSLASVCLSVCPSDFSTLSFKPINI